MYSYICVKCGEVSYSSSPAIYLSSDICPVCKRKTVFVSESTKLGELLVKMDYLSQDDLFYALEQQGKYGDRIGQVLLYLKFITEAQLGNALKFQMEVRA